MIREMNEIENTKQLTELLTEYDRTIFNSIDYKETIFSLGLFEEDHYSGGILGKMRGNTLHISLLAVRESCRKKGYGKQLVTEMEKIAKQHYCGYLTVNTQDYQGLTFYKQLGFTIFGELEDCPFEGTTKYYLKKSII